MPKEVQEVGMTGSLPPVVLPPRCTRSPTGQGDRIKGWRSHTLTALVSKRSAKEKTAGRFLLAVQEANTE